MATCNMAKSNEWIQFNYAEQMNAFAEYVYAASDWPPGLSVVFFAILSKMNRKRKVIDDKWCVPKRMDMFREDIKDFSKTSFSQISDSMQLLIARGLITDYEPYNGHGRPMSFCVTPLPLGNKVTIIQEQTPPPPSQPQSPPPPSAEFNNVELFNDTEITAAAMDLDTELRKAINNIRIVTAGSKFGNIKYYVDTRDPKGVFWGYNNGSTLEYCRIILCDVLNSLAPETAVLFQEGNLQPLISKCGELWTKKIIEVAMSKGTESHFEKIIKKFNPQAIVKFAEMKEILKI